MIWKQEPNFFYLNDRHYIQTAGNQKNNLPSLETHFQLQKIIHKIYQNWSLLQSVKKEYNSSLHFQSTCSSSFYDCSHSSPKPSRFYAPQHKLFRYIHILLNPKTMHN